MSIRQCHCSRPLRPMLRTTPRRSCVLPLGDRPFMLVRVPTCRRGQCVRLACMHLDDRHEAGFSGLLFWSKLTSCSGLTAGQVRSMLPTMPTAPQLVRKIAARGRRVKIRIAAHRRLSSSAGKGKGPCFRPSCLTEDGGFWPKNGPVLGRPVNGHVPSMDQRALERLSGKNYQGAERHQKVLFCVGSTGMERAGGDGRWSKTVRDRGSAVSPSPSFPEVHGDHGQGSGGHGILPGTVFQGVFGRVTCLQSGVDLLLRVATESPRC